MKIQLKKHRYFPVEQDSRLNLEQRTALCGTIGHFQVGRLESKARAREAHSGVGNCVFETLSPMGSTMRFTKASNLIAMCKSLIEQTVLDFWILHRGRLLAVSDASKASPV